MTQTTESKEDEDRKTPWPDAIVSSFFASVSSRDLWPWLREDEQFGLRQEIARGFQQSPKALSQPLVRSRLKAHLERESKIRDNLEKWWREKIGMEVVEAISAIENEDDFLIQQTQLIEQFGFDNLLLAVYSDARFALPKKGETSKPTANRVLEVAPKASSKSENDASLELKKQAQKAEQNALQLKRENENLRAELQKSQREREQEKHQFARRESDAQQKLTNLQKSFEREARRARGHEKELDEQSAEVKRLKRLVRQGQLLQEETRRNLAQIQAQLALPIEEKTPQVAPISTVVSGENKPAKPKKPPRAPKPLFGRDEVFAWKPDGREVRVSPREIKERIDKNDEKFVANLARDIEVLRESDDVLAKRFRSSVRELGRYYNRVLDGATTRVLVDASNVARYEKDGRNRGRLCHLLAMRDELRRYDCFPILFFADASLPHNIDEPDELKAMARRGELEIVDKGTEADDILARTARETGANVVTNDRNFQGRVAPNWEPSRIGFHIRDGIVVLEGLD